MGWSLSILEEGQKKVKYNPLYVESKIQHIRPYLCKKQRDTENTLVVVKGVGKGGMEWEFGISRCKLLNIECINNILYSIGNYI